MIMLHLTSCSLPLPLALWSWLKWRTMKGRKCHIRKWQNLYYFLYSASCQMSIWVSKCVHFLLVHKIFCWLGLKSLINITFTILKVWKSSYLKQDQQPELRALVTMLFQGFKFQLEVHFHLPTWLEKYVRLPDEHRHKHTHKNKKKSTSKSLA